MNKKIGLVVVGILVLVGAFYGGMVYEKSKIPTRGQGTQAFGQNSTGNRGVRNTGALGGFTTGEIISKDDKSITVKLMDGGSKIVFYTDKTSVTKTVDGTSTDLIMGKQISVMGGTNTDGSINAQSVQIRQNATNPVTNSINTN